jgi:hypothetical protein
MVVARACGRSGAEQMRVVVCPRVRGSKMSEPRVGRRLSGIEARPSSEGQRAAATIHTSHSVHRQVSLTSDSRRDGRSIITATCPTVHHREARRSFHHAAPTRGPSLWCAPLTLTQAPPAPHVRAQFPRHSLLDPAVEGSRHPQPRHNVHQALEAAAQPECIAQPSSPLARRPVSHNSATTPPPSSTCHSLRTTSLLP